MTSFERIMQYTAYVLAGTVQVIERRQVKDLLLP
jgi:hypothetical protein